MTPAVFPKVFIIILNFNGGEILRDCLRSVFQLDYPNFEVVLVDNVSTDGSFEMAKENFSRAHFIRSGQNNGFSAGNNLGIRFALEKTADFILLLNPDTLIEKNALAYLVNEAKKHPQAGLFSPVILENKSEKIWFAGGQIEWSKMKTIHLREKPKTDSPFPSEYLTGCALLIRKEVFREIGLLDEKYFLYYEDTDFSWRASRNNFSLLVVPKSKVYHFEKSEGNKDFKNYWLVFSGLIFFQKNATALNRSWIRLYLLGRKAKNWLDLKRNRTALVETTQKAYNDYAQWKISHPASRS